MGSVSIITPSFSGDFERCRLLCDSMDSFVEGAWHHYIIVEEQDFALFQPFASHRRTILRMKEVLPNWLHRVGTIPFANRRSLWFSFKTGWMIGWHIQQIVKIQMAFITKDDALLFCDSDVFFVRPFAVAKLWHEDKLRFYKSAMLQSASEISNPKYLKNAAEVLGLGSDPFPCATYVDNLISWHGPTVRAMCQHLEKEAGKNWMAAIGKRIIFSEYSLYGLFVDRIAGGASSVYTDHHSLCETVWNRDSDGRAELSGIGENLNPAQVALGVQSFLGIDVSDLRSLFNKALKNYGRKTKEST